MSELPTIVFGGGCFWGVEEIFWQIPGVTDTAVGYAGGSTENPTYEQVCSGRTGHTEAVLVEFDPQLVSLGELVSIFFENHDPTQIDRQGNDVGTQYLSAIYVTSPEALPIVIDVAQRFSPVLTAAGYGKISTEMAELTDVGNGQFYYAETYHQKYLAKNPNGYRCHGATGFKVPRK